VALTAQLMNSDTNVCWGATYDAADVMVTNGKLKARSSAQ